MLTVTTTIRGVSPYSQSRMHAIPRADKETADDHERRTWRNRVHVGADGNTFIPPMSLKKSIAAASKSLGKIPGKGNNQYAKHFVRGVLISEVIPLYTPDGSRATLESWEGEPLHLDAQGKSGGGTRVLRFMPRLVEGWSATAKILVLDETITEALLRRTLTEAGNLIGVGRFRPENGGYYGRFSVETFEAV